MKLPSHPPRPGVRRLIHEGYLDTVERRREFAAAVQAINMCGLAVEIECHGFGCSGDGRIVVYATRRVRTTSTESR